MFQITFLLLAVVWLLPNHYPPWINFHSEALSFIGLALLIFASLKSKAGILSLPPIGLLALILAIIPLAQYVLGLGFFAGDVFISAFFCIGLAGAIAVGYSQSMQSLEQRGVIWLMPTQVLVAASAVSTLLAFLQWLALADSISEFLAVTDVGDRAMANLGQPNQLATLLMMGLLGLVMLFECFKLSKAVLVLGAVLLTWGMALTESRTVMLSALVVALFMTYKVINRRVAGEPLRLQIREIAIWLGGFTAAVVLLPAVNSALLLDGVREGALLDSSGRGTIWLQTLYAIKASPWLGYGWNQTHIAHAAGALYYPGDMLFGNAHNIVLDLLVWVGLPLGLFLTIVFGYWFYSRVQLVKSTGAIYAMAMLLPFFVHSMLEYPFAYAYFLLMAGLLAGVVEADCLTTRAYTVAKPAAAFTLALMTAAGGYAAFEYVQVEEDYRVARFENLKVGTTPLDYARPAILVHTQLAALLTATRQPAVRNMTDVQMERLRKVSLRFGNRPLVYRYAVALGLNGEPVAAARQMVLFRGMYGEPAYKAFSIAFRTLQAEKYPELAAVMLP